MTRRNWLVSLLMPFLVSVGLVKPRPRVSDLASLYYKRKTLEVLKNKFVLRRVEDVLADTRIIPLAGSSVKFYRYGKESCGKS